PRCGVAGLWAPRLTKPERLGIVSAMLAGLEHRGPSGSAAWDGEGVALGLARLAIVAPQARPAVFANEDGALRAVVNGEVYNHAALRAQLERRGHAIDSGIDTAVILHLYEEHGVAFPEKLDGMFAVAVWDARRARLVPA